MKRKICIVTGTRAEYGLLKPIMQKIKEESSLSLQVIATGTHLLKEYGNTIDLIIEDGFNVDAKVPIIFAGEGRELLPHSIGHGIIGFSQAFEVLDPEIVLILGDRYEILAAAIAASYSGRVLVHIHGGDKTMGGYDEYTRHAITKISHIHFPATQKSAERIIKLGENPEYVHVCGSPSLETINSIAYLDKKELFDSLNLSENTRKVLFVYHPINNQHEDARDEVSLLLNSILEFQCQIIIIYPNVDPGSRSVIEVIEKYGSDFPNRIKLFKNLPHHTFLNIMKWSDIMIGNSSSGIIESPAFKIPVINIGTRQDGRERAENVIDCNISHKEITEAIEKCLYNEKFKTEIQKCINPYGEGKCSDIILNEIKKLQITRDLFSKNISCEYE